MSRVSQTRSRRRGAKAREGLRVDETAGPTFGEELGTHALELGRGHRLPFIVKQPQAIHSVTEGKASGRLHNQRDRGVCLQEKRRAENVQRVDVDSRCGGDNEVAVADGNLHDAGPVLKLVWGVLRPAVVADLHCPLVHHHGLEAVGLDPPLHQRCLRDCPVGSRSGKRGPVEGPVERVHAARAASGSPVRPSCAVSQDKRVEAAHRKVPAAGAPPHASDGGVARGGGEEEPPVGVPDAIRAVFAATRDHVRDRAPVGLREKRERREVRRESSQAKKRSMHAFSLGLSWRIADPPLA